MGFLGGVGKAIGQAVKNIGNGIAKAVKDVAAPILKQAKDIFQAIAKGDIKKLAGAVLPLALPSPLRALVRLVQASKVDSANNGDVLKQLSTMLGNANVNGTNVTLPTLGDRAGTVSQTAQAVIDAITSGQIGASGSIGGSQGTGSGMYSTAWSKDQIEGYNAAKAGGASEAELARMKAQNDMQNHAELMAFLSNMQKMRHDTLMSIIQNIR